MESSGSNSLPSTPSPQNFSREREALARLIASGEFHRSPNLEKILVYLCTQYFEGRANRIKEYTVATEALDRREDFDPKKDSIVRVEMLRLRRRLREYYAGRGSNELVRINVPDKSYVPEFQFVAETPVAPASAPDLTIAPVARPEPGLVSRPIFLNPHNLVPLLGALAVMLLGGWWLYQRTQFNAAAANPRPAETVAYTAAAGVLRTTPVSSGSTEIRILAGHPKGRYPDRNGILWIGDEYFTGGTAVSIDAHVHTRGFDNNLFTNKREGDFTYDIPLPAGVYELMLIFAETGYGDLASLSPGETSRAFHVHINGRTELSNYDVLADAHDPNTATARMFRDVQPAADGKLHLRFESSLSGKAFVNAIVIRPGIPGAIRPIRIVCRPNLFRDSNGDVWEADHFYRGGTQITRPTGAANPRDPDLFRGERYGKFTYAIPVPHGKYQARLFFNEYWWGADRPGQGGPGSRIFDVFCNFRPLLMNVDLLKRSPRDRWLVETFHGLEPNLDSQLVFDFEPRANFALLNAIEIADDKAILPPH